jgi:hypothetical protein
MRSAGGSHHSSFAVDMYGFTPSVCLGNNSGWVHCSSIKVFGAAFRLAFFGLDQFEQSKSFIYFVVVLSVQESPSSITMLLLQRYHFGSGSGSGGVLPCSPFWRATAQLRRQRLNAMRRLRFKASRCSSSWMRQASFTGEFIACQWAISHSSQVPTLTLFYFRCKKVSNCHFNFNEQLISPQVTAPLELSPKINATNKCSTFNKCTNFLFSLHWTI